MSKFLLVAMFFISGCAGLPTNVVDNTIPPTIVKLEMPKEKAMRKVSALIAKSGWKREVGDTNSDMIVADDPTVIPGWLMAFHMRYIFTFSEEANLTNVNIEGVSVMHGDNGPFVKDGRTSAAKYWEDRAAKKLSTTP